MSSSLINRTSWQFKPSHISNNKANLVFYLLSKYCNPFIYHNCFSGQISCHLSDIAIRYHYPLSNSLLMMPSLFSASEHHDVSFPYLSIKRSFLHRKNCRRHLDILRYRKESSSKPWWSHDSELNLPPARQHS